MYKNEIATPTKEQKYLCRNFMLNFYKKYGLVFNDIEVLQDVAVDEEDKNSAVPDLSIYMTGDEKPFVVIEIIYDKENYHLEPKNPTFVYNEGIKEVFSYYSLQNQWFRFSFDDNPVKVTEIEETSFSEEMRINLADLMGV
jgi:hypothetical protein